MYIYIYHHRLSLSLPCHHQSRGLAMQGHINADQTIRRHSFELDLKKGCYLRCAHNGLSAFARPWPYSQGATCTRT